MRPGLLLAIRRSDIFAGRRGARGFGNGLRRRFDSSTVWTPPSFLRSERHGESDGNFGVASS
jgi:hypothetical protein